MTTKAIKADKNSPRVLQVSLEGLDLSEEQFGRLEDTMRTAVLAELARFRLPKGITMESIGRGTIRDGGFIHGIIIRDLHQTIREQLDLGKNPIRR